MLDQTNATHQGHEVPTVWTSLFGAELGRAKYFAIDGCIFEGYNTPERLCQRTRQTPQQIL